MADRRSLASSLLFAYAAAFLVLIAVLGFAVDRVVRSALVSDLIDDLAASATFVADRLGDEPASAVRDLEGIAGGARVTVIDREGVVLADTAEDPAVMENHSDRPEVIEAFAGRVGSIRRFSVTLSEPLLYVAIPPRPGSDVVVRLALLEDSVTERLGAFRFRVLAGTALAGLLGVLLVALVAGQLAKPIRRLTARAEEVAMGDLSGRSPRSSVAELDALGAALDRMADDLQTRMAASEESRQALEVILRALPVGVLVVERTGGVSYANESAQRMMRGDRDSLALLLPQAFRRALDQARNESAATATSTLGPPPRTLRMNAFSLGEGRALGVIEDVTDEERMEAMRRDFVAAASHELKTPIAAVRAAAEALDLALDRDLDRARSFAEMITASTIQLSRIVSDLLDLSRLEVSEMHFVRVDLAETATEAASTFKDVFRQRSISLNVDLEPVSVTGSRADLGLAVRNLIDNALRYTDAGGAVSLRVVGEGELAVVQVKDTGVGIPARSVSRVFERFYRVDSARSRATGGTGLGLAIVKHVVERHGGSVSVASSLGSGSEFTLRLPASDPGNTGGEAALPVELHQPPPTPLNAQAER